MQFSLMKMNPRCLQLLFSSLVSIHRIWLLQQTPKSVQDMRMPWPVTDFPQVGFFNTLRFLSSIFTAAAHSASGSCCIRSYECILFLTVQPLRFQSKCHGRKNHHGYGKNQISSQIYKSDLIFWIVSELTILLDHCSCEKITKSTHFNRKSS